MIDTSASGSAYNRFINLDGIEDRVISYLISEEGKNSEELKRVHTIWRILSCNDVDALDDISHPLPSQEEVMDLIYQDNTDQSEKRIFRSPRLDDSWTQKCSLIKVYVDSIVPTNHILAVVNVGIDVVVNTNIINLQVPEYDEGAVRDNGDPIVDDTYKDETRKGVNPLSGAPIKIQTKSRVTALVHAILYLLNGAEVAGVGKMVFSRQLSIYDQAKYGLWNNRDYEGIKLVIGCNMAAKPE